MLHSIKSNVFSHKHKHPRGGCRTVLKLISAVLLLFCISIHSVSYAEDSQGLPTHGPYILESSFNEDYTQLTIEIDNRNGNGRKADHWFVLAGTNITNITDDNYSSLGGESEGWRYLHYTYDDKGSRNSPPPNDLATQGATITHTLNLQSDKLEAFDGEQLKIFLLKNEYKRDDEAESKGHLVNYDTLHTMTTPIYKSAATLERERAEAEAAAAAVRLTEAKTEAIDALTGGANAKHITNAHKKAIIAADNVAAVEEQKQKALTHAATLAALEEIITLTKEATKEAENAKTAAKEASSEAERKAYEASLNYKKSEEYKAFQSKDSELKRKGSSIKSPSQRKLLQEYITLKREWRVLRYAYVMTRAYRAFSCRAELQKQASDAAAAASDKAEKAADNEAAILAGIEKIKAAIAEE